MPSREERRWQHFHANEEMRAVRKQLKRNRKPKRVRRRDWMPDGSDEFDELLMEPSPERVMPRGERERRQKLMAAALAKLELEQETAAEEAAFAVEEASGSRGIVVEVSSGLCRVDIDGRLLLCGLRGSLSASDTGFTNVVAVGDEVVVSEDGQERGIVESVLPRRSVLARPDVFHAHLRQVIVANADQLLIVASWKDPALWFELVDRYLITAVRNNLSGTICVNKIDLAEDITSCRAALRPYQDLGYQVFFTSALTGEGVEDVQMLLRGRTTVLAGLSGVGKSTLLTAVQPDLELRTGEISEVHREGRHITTQVSLLKLTRGGLVVDTPGIREFGLAGLRQSELAAFYPEIRSLHGHCRFSDCTHIHEPDCAVVAGVRDGLMSATRYHSYSKILDSLPA